MNRKLTDRLIEWKNGENRKPLIIRGARQVGKTWLIKEFGRTQYEQTLYINFESNKALKNLFTEDFDLKRMMMALQIESGVNFNSANTLIIFDEIQEAPGAITSLKYFYENAPEYHIISAGSLLGIAMHASTSFPVGKVDFLDLHPLNFLEFLRALGENALVNLIEQPDWTLINTFKAKYIRLLRLFYFIGGMPEAVLSFSEKNDFEEVRAIQRRILTAYEQDFSKNVPVEIVPRIRMLWNSVPSQLAKENRKFIYGLIKTGARAKEYEVAMSWLTDCGLVHKVHRITKPALPLQAYVDLSAFKLFLVDIGLLNAMGDLDVKTLLEGSRIFEEFKGALTEQFVLQQLILEKEFTICYWSPDRSVSEIDFTIQFSGKIIPVEVKAEENLKAKSLRFYCQKYEPLLAIRTSMSDYRNEGSFTNLPLYAINALKKL